MLSDVLKAMKQSKFEQIKLISIIGLPLLAIVFLVFFLDFKNIRRLGGVLDTQTILLVIAISFIRPLSGGFRASFAYKPINQLNIIDASKGYILSAYGTIFFPSTVGGDILRIEHMKNCTGSTRKEALLVAALERIIGLFCLLFLAIFSIFILSLLSINVIDMSNSIPGFWFVYFIIIAIICISILVFSFKKFKNYKRFDQIKEYITSYATPSVIIGIFILSLIFQCISLCIPVIIGYALGGINVAINIALITPIVALFSTLPISIGGFGLREVSYVGIGALLSNGIDSEICFLVGLSLSLSIIISGLPGIFFQNELISVKKKNKGVSKNE